MQTHVLTVTYSGLLADYGVMDALLGERVQHAARRLLAANAYYYTRGYVPARLRSRTRDFQIVERAPEYGSLTRELLVAIAGSAIYDAAKVPFPEFAIAAVALSGLGLLSMPPSSSGMRLTFERQRSVDEGRPDEEVPNVAGVGATQVDRENLDSFPLGVEESRTPQRPLPPRAWARIAVRQIP